jgi:hypothetical protein
VIGDPSRLRVIRKTAALARISPYFDFSIEENAARRKWKYDDPKFDSIIVYYESIKREPKI